MSPEKFWLIAFQGVPCGACKINSAFGVTQNQALRVSACHSRPTITGACHDQVVKVSDSRLYL